MKGAYCATFPFSGYFDKMFDGVQVINGIHLPEDAKFIVFTGGEDVTPSLYKEENENSYSNIFRDRIELRLFEQAMERRIKVFGVCRGHQLINVALGGKLIQNIVPHHMGEHKINWISSSAPFHLNFVNSLHHQGYRENQMATSMMSMATHDDGIVEVAMSKDGNVFTVQFHPEMMGTGWNGNLGLINFVKSWAEGEKQDGQTTG